VWEHVSARLILPDGSVFDVTRGRCEPAPGQTAEARPRAATLTRLANSLYRTQRRDLTASASQADCLRARLLAQTIVGARYECN
jgi:hypothetical protein